MAAQLAGCGIEVRQEDITISATDEKSPETAADINTGGVNDPGAENADAIDDGSGEYDPNSEERYAAGREAQLINAVTEKKTTGGAGGERVTETVSRERLTTTAASVETHSGDDGGERFAAVVNEARFFHEGRGEWLAYYYADMEKAQFEILKNGLGDYYDSGINAAYEVQIYSDSDNINLKNYVGKLILFSGEWFAAQTIYHRRDIVFAIQVIWEAGEPGEGYSPPLIYQMDGMPDGTPLEPTLAGYGASYWFNGDIVSGRSFEWAEYEDGSGKLCLMVLVDAAEPSGGCNRQLILPYYGTPNVGRIDRRILLDWINPSDTQVIVELMFEEQSNQLKVNTNYLTYEMRTVDMPVSVYRDDSEYDRYYVPLYAILNEVGGGIIADPFGGDTAYIFTGIYTQSYDGFWETSDRGENRVDAVIGGAAHSIPAYWNGLSLRPDGSFTDTRRSYRKGTKEWLLSEWSGRYFFWRRVLIFSYETLSEWRGTDYAALAPIRIGDTTGAYVTGRYVEDWDEDYLSMASYEPLYAHLAERGETSPEPGKTGG